MEEEQFPSDADRFDRSYLKDDEDNGDTGAHLTGHNEEAEPLETVLALLQEEARERQNVWYTKHERLGQTEGYRKDIERALKRVQRQSRQHYERGETIPTLGLELRFCLILASLNSLDPSPTDSQEGKETRPEALPSARRINDCSARAKTLAGLAPYLTAEQVQEALCVVREIEPIHLRADALQGLLPFMTEEQLEETLVVARDMQDTFFLSSVRKSLLAALTASGKLGLARFMAQDIQDPAEYAYALLSFLPFFAVGHEQSQILSAAWSAARKITNTSHRGSCFSALAAYLPEGPEKRQMLSEALSIARSVEDGRERARELVRLVGHLLEGEEQARVLSEALSSVREIEDGWQRSFAFADLAASLASQGQIDSAIAAAREIEELTVRVKTLLALLPHLTEGRERTQALSDALAASWGIAAHRTRVRWSDGAPRYSWQKVSYHDHAMAFRALAPHLTERQRRQTLRDVRELESSIARIPVFAALAPCLTTEEFQEALSIACEYGNHLEPSSSLQALGPYLTEEQLQDALAIARTIDPDHSRHYLLSVLAASLAKKGKQKQALAIVREMQPGSRADTLIALTPHLTAKQLQEARLLAGNVVYNRSQVLSGILPYLTGEKLQEALAATPEMENDLARQEMCSAILARLQQASFEEFYPKWEALVGLMVLQTRDRVQSRIAELSAAIQRWGGAEAMSEVIRAIRDMARWWP